jgi:hypothetical protein
MEQRDRKHATTHASRAHMTGGIAGDFIRHDWQGFHWCSRWNMSGETVLFRLTAEAGKFKDFQDLRVFRNYRLSR